MKKNSTHKKLISAVVVVCIIVTTLFAMPLSVSAVFKEEFQFRYNNTNFTLTESNNTVTVNYIKDVSTNTTLTALKTYSAKNGIHMDFSGISSPNSAYTVAVQFGNTPASSGLNITKKGFVLLYSTNGAFSIVTTPTSSPYYYKAKTSDTASVSDTVAALNGKFSLDVVLTSDKKYSVTLTDSNNNAKAVVYDPSLAGLTDFENLNCSVAISTALTDTNFSSADKVKTGSKFSVLIRDTVDNGSNTPPEGMSYSGKTLFFKQKNNDLTVTRVATGYAYERVSYISSYYLGNDGLCFNIKDIKTDSTGFSIVLGFGAETNIWTDKTGIMLFYDTDGDFAVIKSDAAAGNPNNETVLACGKATPSDTVKIGMKLLGNNYIFSLNDSTFVVDAANLSYAPDAFVSVGVMSAYTLNTETPAISNLKYWQDNFITADASFTISGPIGEVTKEQIPVGVDTPPENMSVVGEGGFLFDQQQDGLMITSTKDNASWHRINYTVPYLASGTGATLKIDKIACDVRGWSMAFYIGGTGNGWYDKMGLMVLYDRDGDFAIIGTDGSRNEKGDVQNPNEADLLQADRVEYTDSVSMNVRQLVNDDYVITFNGKEYPIAKKWLSGSDEVFFNFGIMTGFDLSKDLTDLSNLKHASVCKNKILTFMFGGIDGEQPKPESEIYVGSEIIPDDMTATGSHFRYLNTEKGLQITHTYDGAAYERTSYKYGYSVEGDGVTLKITDITSRSRTYSLAVGIGGGGAMWYDSKGIMVFYDRNGNIAVTEATGIPNESGGPLSPNNAKILASGKLESFSNSLTISIKKQGDQYLFNVNGIAFNAAQDYLNGSDQVVFGFGVMSDFTLVGDDMENLQYWQDGFKTKNVSFTIADIIGVSTKDDPITAKPLTKEQSGINCGFDGMGIYEDPDGVLFVHYGDGASWQRAYYVNQFCPAGAGIHFAVKNIKSKAKDYALTVKLGTQGTWYDTRGYQILYGKSGNFSIVATAKEFTNPNISPVLVDEVREPLGETYTLDVQLKGTNYEITVNGKKYTVPAQHAQYPVENMQKLTLGFGIMNDARVGGIKHASSSFKSNNVSFVITEATGMIPPENQGDSFEMNVVGYHWDLNQMPNGTKLTLGTGGTGLERVSTKKAYSTKQGGLLIKLSDIASEDPNYSVAVMLSDCQDPWYDCAGYMVVYGKNGDFSILATDSSVINPSKSAVMVSEIREKLGSDLSVNVRLDGKNYKITVNGKTYTVLAKNKSYPLTDRENLYVGLGAFSAGNYENLVYNNLFLKSPLSFTVNSVAHNEKLAVKEVDVPDEDDTDDVDVDDDDGDDGDSDITSDSDHEKEPEKKVEEKEETGSNTVLWIAISAIAVLLIAAGVFFFLYKKKRK